MMTIGTTGRRVPCFDSPRAVSKRWRQGLERVWPCLEKVGHPSWAVLVGAEKRPESGQTGNRKRKRKKEHPRRFSRPGYPGTQGTGSQLLPALTGSVSTPPSAIISPNGDRRRSADLVLVAGGGGALRQLRGPGEQRTPAGKWLAEWKLPSIPANVAPKTPYFLDLGDP